MGLLTSRKMGWSPSGLLWGLLLVCLIVEAGLAKEDSRKEYAPDGSQICRTVEIRNNPENFKALENCSVIEGNLVIAVLHYRNPQEPDIPDTLNYSFPQLREITGYVLVFRSHLNNMTRLFPNLAVIRGMELLEGHYALIIYENPLMTTLGLKSLTHIMRGGVRIEKNPRLCHVESIDWSRITQDPQAPEIYNKFNRESRICPRCQTSCPLGSIVGTHLCWNYETCQKDCSCQMHNGTCMDDQKTCCDKQCLGGCTGQNGTQGCFVCLKYTLNGRCVDKCPSNTFALNGRRCVSEQACRDYKPTEDSPQYKPFNGSQQGECLPACPAGYLENAKDPSGCVRCKGQCPFICGATRPIKSVHDARMLKGCTILNTSLIIEITSGVGVSVALNESLSSLEEIHGYLKVARTPSLVSLAFLQNLRVIHGRTQYSNYSVVVQDNANLQEFWDWNKKDNFTIRAGKLYFHHNQKLCYKTIVTFKNNSGLANLELKDQDVSPLTNGDRMPCDMIELKMTIKDVQSRKCTVEWDTIVENYFEDHRHLHTYTVFYAKVAEDVNVTVFDGRDACGSDDWSTAYLDQDAGRPDAANKEQITLTGLEPFTRYAVYVKTEMLIEASKAAQSHIQYFRTSMGTPSVPRKLMADSKAPNELDVRWETPDRPNGIVEWYLVVGLVQQDIDVYMTRRDFCADHHRIVLPTTPPGGPKIDKGNETDEVTDCSKCKCEGRMKKTLSRQEKQEAMEFEDTLHDLIFRKRTPKAKKSKRDITEEIQSDRSTTVSTNHDHVKMVEAWMSEDDDWGNIPKHYKNCSYNRDERDGFCNWVLGDHFSVGGLKHFTNYIVEVVACHDKKNMAADGLLECDLDAERIFDGSKTNMCCSKPQRIVKRTLKLRGADDVDISTLRVEQHGGSTAAGSNVSTETANGNSGASAYLEGGVQVTWDPPPNPNAFIVSYTLEYTRDVEGALPTKICIDHKEYNTSRGRVLRGLGTGNHSFRVRATSLSGPGNWTRYESFYVRDTSEGQRYVTLFISILIIIIVIIGVFSFGAYHIAKKKLKRGIPDAVLYASMNPEYMSTSYEPDEWEVPRDKIKLLNELGQGSFGMVYQGIVFDLNGIPELDCAVKTVNEGAQVHERNEFLQEASTMKRFDSYHVVKLLGVVSKGQPVYVIMELMSNGDLKSFLRSHRPDQDDPPKGDPPTYRQVVQMAAEIADGMAYLASLKYVHRDLAARNCMVSHDLTVKIGDFGMTRDIYETDYYRKGGKGLLPVRWMSPESLKDGVFTTQGDVWSYGVVLWEMVTLATMPYQGLTNEQVLKWVISRHIMERPEHCPDKLYQIMKLCWHYNPKSRPKFTDIVDMLLDDTHDNFRKYSYFTTTFSTTIRPDEGIDDRGPGTSGEGTPLVVQPSHKVGGLASIRDGKSLRGTDAPGHDLGAADLDEESNLYISDDVISDGEGEESGAENSDNSDHRQKNASRSSLPKHHTNSDYGSARSPLAPLLLGERDSSGGDGPPASLERQPPTNAFPAFPGMTSLVARSFSEPPVDGTPNNVGPVKAGGNPLTATQNGAIPTPANGRVFVPVKGGTNRTTAC